MPQEVTASRDLTASPHVCNRRFKFIPLTILLGSVLKAAADQISPAFNWHDSTSGCLPLAIRHIQFDPLTKCAIRAR